MKERYGNLDGLRAISCLRIIAMHIRANADYNLGTVGSPFVASRTHFVPLFLMISGFGMFCSYYERFKSGNIDLNSFYSKRYKKLLPFFITLILIDVVMDRSFSHVIEGITEATLVFWTPSKQSVRCNRGKLDSWCHLPLLYVISVYCVFVLDEEKGVDDVYIVYPPESVLLHLLLLRQVRDRRVCNSPQLLVLRPVDNGGYCLPLQRNDQGLYSAV